MQTKTLLQKHFPFVHDTYVRPFANSLLSGLPRAAESYAAYLATNEETRHIEQYEQGYGRFHIDAISSEAQYPYYESRPAPVGLTPSDAYDSHRFHVPSLIVDLLEPRYAALQYFAKAYVYRTPQYNTTHRQRVWQHVQALMESTITKASDQTHKENRVSVILDTLSYNTEPAPFIADSDEERMYNLYIEHLERTKARITNVAAQQHCAVSVVLAAREIYRIDDHITTVALIYG